MEARSPTVTKRNAFDFSIESLLKTNSNQSTSDFKIDQHVRQTYFIAPDASNDITQVKEEEFHSQYNEEITGNEETFSWLNCTRFKPPKLPRSKKRCTSSKRFGRGPRIPFSPQQISILEHTFSSSQYLSSDNILDLAKALHLTETRVKIWFQNRRARYRREKEGQPNCPSSGLLDTPSPLPSSGSPNQDSIRLSTTKEMKFFNTSNKSSEFIADKHRLLNTETSNNSDSHHHNTPHTTQQGRQPNFLPLGKHDPSSPYPKDFLLSSETSKLYFLDYLRRHNSEIYAIYQQPTHPSGSNSNVIEDRSHPFTSTLSPNFHRDSSASSLLFPNSIHHPSSHPHHLTFPYVTLHE